MADRFDELAELESLRAPRRSDIERRRARDSILAAAEPLLARRRRPASSWEVLAGWARPGLVAASIALAVVVGSLRLGGADDPALDPVALDEVLAGSGTGEVPTLLVALSEPDAEAVLTELLVRDSGLPEENENGGEQR
jgi:hypothetical protein